MRSFDEIFEDKTKYGTKIKTSEYKEIGKYAIIDQGQEEIAGYTDLEKGVFEDVPAIIFGDHTRVIKYVRDPFFLGADGVKILKCKELNVNYKYLYYALKNAKIPNTGYNRHFKWLKQIQIEYPSIDKQEKIVKILDKVVMVIEDRRKEIQELDKLIKARFVEMFGDIKVNPNGYQLIKMRNLIASCEAGWSGNGIQRPKKENEIAVLKVSSVTKGYFIPEECKVLDNQDNIKKYISPKKGDLIFSRANTREMVGATAITLEDYPKLILPDKLWRVRFGDKVNVFYMKYMLSSKSIREQFSAVSTGTSGSMFNVSMEKFKSIEIPVAPINLQNQFADFVKQVNKSKVVYQIIINKLTFLQKICYNNYKEQYHIPG